MRKFLITLAIILFGITPTFSQGYLHVDGKYIYDGAGNEVILRGIGTGNWMIQEGYMMKSSDAGLGTQHAFRNKLIETIGVAKTDSFYNAWLKYHFTKTDVDSMKAWGFNSIRVALHYIWFTPPIEDEPVQGEITWIAKGFEMTDSLLKWCSDNEMYLILDMHGTPGGQGKNADISDYDPSKPSLWESDDNKSKLIALWKKLAERYNDEPWIGGYDLINETNWDFENSNNENGCNCNQNTPLVELFKDIIDEIRVVDTNHIVYLGGNCWGNNYNGVTSLASYDDNLVFSFHKYWNYNNENALDWITSRRETLNVPVWLGESGENSNTWFTNAISLCETNHVGWSWWPVKKNGINNILRVKTNPEYQDLLDYWAGSGSAPSADDAFQALLGWAEAHKFENCEIAHDVIDAMIRQPHSKEAKVFKNFGIDETIFASDYDLGRNNVAYYDVDTADYRVDAGTYTAWNQGWAYRSDGVDIESCTDTEETNGFNLGWSADGEWVQYTVTADSTAGYTLQIRHTSGSSGSKAHIEIDGASATQIISLQGTGGWQNWQTNEVEGIIFPEGTHKVRFIWDQGGSNLNYFKFANPVPQSSIDFKSIRAKSSTDGKVVYISLNKAITSDNQSIVTSEFNLVSDGIALSIDSIKISSENPNILQLFLSSAIYYGTTTTVSYTGSSVLNGEEGLTSFTDLVIENNLPQRHTLPARIQAENFYYNNGLVLEECSDAGGGYNTGYAASGDYLDYLVFVETEDHYALNYRVATTASNAYLVLQHNASGSFFSVDTIHFSATGGWQNWETQRSDAILPAGRYTLRLYVMQGEHNINWIDFSEYTDLEQNNNKISIDLYPNPAQNYLSINLNDIEHERIEITVYNLHGAVALQEYTNNNRLTFATNGLPNGLYTVAIRSAKGMLFTSKLAVQR